MDPNGDIPEIEIPGEGRLPSARVDDTWQKRWRFVGGVTIGLCGLMAWFGVDMAMLRESTIVFLIYWGVFALLFFVTLYIVALDLRYIRAQHAIAQRDLFCQTLGEQEFREALREAITEAKEDAGKDDDRSS